MSRSMGTPAELERRRRRPVQLVEEGEPRSTVARILGVQLSSLSRWLKRARQPNGLDARPIPGPPCKLSTDQLQKLEELLAAGAVKHGWANNLWTAPRVAEVIERHFGVRYNPGHVCRILKT